MKSTSPTFTIFSWWHTNCFVENYLEIVGVVVTAAKSDFRYRQVGS